LRAAEAEVHPAYVGSEYLDEVQGFHEFLFTGFLDIIHLLFSSYSQSSGLWGALIFLKRSNRG
jgi:hypothetical protein